MIFLSRMLLLSIRHKVFMPNVILPFEKVTLKPSRRTFLKIKQRRFLMPLDAL